KSVRMDTGTPPVLKVTHYETAERDRIRRSLLRYMQENRIGVPKLQMLIVRANGYSKDQIDNVPLKTLQRFLADTHRTNDTFVTLWARVAEGLPDDAPAADLGVALTRFMKGKVIGDGPRTVPARVVGAYDGTLEVTGRPEAVRYSRLRVDRVFG